MPLGDALQRSVEKLGEKAASVPTLGTAYSTGDVTGWMPSGLTPLDCAIGGGLPMGRISELYSKEESEGKSSLALHFAASCQKAGGVVVWLESEAALDKVRAKRMGLQLDKVVIYGPPTCEDGFAYIKNIVGNIREEADLKDVPVFIVWDTIAAAPIRAVKEEDNAYADGMTKKPRVIREALQDLTLEFFNHKIHLLLVNHTYASLDRFGPKMITSGGRGIRNHSTTRIELYRTGMIQDEKEQPIGIEVTFFIKKSKLCLPHRKAHLVLYGENGFDEVMSMAKNFIEWGMSDMLKQAGGWYSAPGGKGGMLKCRWKDLREQVLGSPVTLQAWRAKFNSLWPLPKGREVDPKSGWVVPSPGALTQD